MHNGMSHGRWRPLMPLIIMLLGDWCPCGQPRFFELAPSLGHNDKKHYSLRSVSLPRHSILGFVLPNLSLEMAFTSLRPPVTGR